MKSDDTLSRRVSDSQSLNILSQSFDAIQSGIALYSQEFNLPYKLY